jgi:NitT/TauT family transport system ATP-binding protein
MNNTAHILDISHVEQSFLKAWGKELKVLDDINLTLQEGEIVGLLGRSGCGKSTLLRIIAGLIPPTNGDIMYLDQRVTGPASGIAMVFQNFALFPWLTVLQNVKLGLETLGLSEDEMQRRALAAIDLIGLDGFESAYPKELSGGMQQRVGFARAMVVHPTIMLMDEPFSSLDVLTAETLRTDFLDLWSDKKLPIKSVLMVSHNIEEAVLMCDRVLILSPAPGHIEAEIRINLPHPRKRQDVRFRAVVEDVYMRMTAKSSVRSAVREAFSGITINSVLQRVSTNILSGFMETLANEPYNGKADLPHLAETLKMEIDDMFPIAEVLQLLRFADVAEGDITLGDAGKRFAQMAVDDRKRLFATHLLAYVPLAAHIRRVLDERPNHMAPFDRFKGELEDHMREDLAEQTLRAIISWSRYAEVFSYDENTHSFSLENPT